MVGGGVLEWGSHCVDLCQWAADAMKRGWKAVVEYCADGARREIELWPGPGSDQEIMRRVKQMFDPQGLLNRGRLYRRI